MGIFLLPGAFAFTATTASASTLRPAITSVSIASDGTVIVNGAAFLPISGQKVDYNNWGQAGYTTPQADAKLVSLTANGMNTVMGNWGDTMPDQAQNMWTTHNCYWLGNGTLFPNNSGQSWAWGNSASRTAGVTAINARNYSNLLSWNIAVELNPQIVWSVQSITVTPSNSGGSLPSGTRYVTVFPVSGTEQGPTSLEVSYTVVGPNGSAAVSWPVFGTMAVAGTAAHVYDGTASGQQPQFYSVPAGTTNFTITQTSAGTAGFISSNPYSYTAASQAISSTASIANTSGDVQIYDPTFEQFLIPTLNRYVRAELTSYGPIVTLTTGVQGEYTALPIQQIFNASDNLRKNTQPFVTPGMSITAEQELMGNYPSPADDFPRPYFAIRRCYLLPIACGCKTVELLWGPNQRSGQWQNNGDTDLTNHWPALLDSIWPNHLQALSEVSALSSMITGNGTFTQVTTTAGGFSFPPLQTTVASNVFLLEGLYAAKKTVGATTWVMAVNLVQAVTASGDATYPNQAVDQTLVSATIHIGQTINTATRWVKDPTQGSVSFNGATITDNFTPGEVHVYLVT